MKKATTTTATAEKAINNNFEIAKQNFCTAYAKAPNDCADALQTLATACALSVLNYCIDPQRKDAQNRDTTSNSGINPALLSARGGILHDNALLDNVRNLSDTAIHVRYNADGDAISDTLDANALKALNAIVGDTLSDGIDLVQEASTAILEQAQDHADNGTGWFDKPYTMRVLSQKVLINEDDSKAYKEVQTTPIQEVYRAVRRAIGNSRAMQTDPRNGYTYIEDMTADGLEQCYIRLGKYSDLGGYPTAERDSNAGCPSGYPSASGVGYTADRQTLTDYNSVLRALKLSDRQLTVIKLRMRGYGCQSIATYLGTNEPNVFRIVRQCKAKAEKIGFTPSMWAEMIADRDNDNDNDND